jgi:hypothetical protein
LGAVIIAITLLGFLGGNANNFTLISSKTSSKKVLRSRGFACRTTGMSKRQYRVICALSALCLILAVEKQRLTQQNRHWQNQAGTLQAAVDGSLRNRIGPQRVDALFQDLGNLSLSNSQIRRLLVDHGYLVTNRPPPDSVLPASAPDRRQP